MFATIYLSLKTIQTCALLPFGVTISRSFSHTLLRHQRGILYHCFELLSVASVGSLCFFTSVQATTYFILASQVIK